MKKIAELILTASLLVTSIGAVPVPAAAESGSLRIEAEDFISDNASSRAGAYTENDASSGVSYGYAGWKQVWSSDDTTKYTMYVDAEEDGWYFLHAGMAVYDSSSTAYLSPVAFTINGTDTRTLLKGVKDDSAKVRELKAERIPYATVYGTLFDLKDYYTYEPVHLNKGRNTVDFTVYNRKNNPTKYNNGNAFSNMFIAGLDYVQFDAATWSADERARIEADSFIKMNSGSGGSRIEETGKASDDYYVRWTEVKTEDESTTFRMYADVTEEGDYYLCSGMSVYDGNGDTAFESSASFTVNDTDTRYVYSADGTHADLATDYDDEPYGSFYINKLKMREYKTVETVHLNSGRNIIDFTVYNRNINPVQYNGGNAFSSMFLAAIDYIRFVNVLDPEEPDDPDEGRPDVKLTCDENGDFTILCVSDPQWYDPQFNKQMSQCIDARDDLQVLIDRVNPDFVMIEGDMTTSGEIDPEEWKAFIAPLTERHIKWATINGNHDVFKKAHYKMYVGYEDCLNHVVAADDPNYDEEKPMNYVIPIYANNGEDTVFAVYGMDTGTMRAYGFDGCSEKQIAWYRAQSDKLKAANGGNPVTSLFCGHIPFSEVITMYNESKGNFYGLCGNNSVDGTKQRYNYGMLQAIKEQGDVKLAVFGHDHLNNFIGMTDGLLTGYTGKIGSGDQDDFYARGGRVIRFNQANPEKFTTEWYGVMHTAIDQPALYSDGTRADK